MRSRGLRGNWRQFGLLVVINAFVGSLVGIERAILPVLAEQDFGVASRAALLSFIASFGLAKAVSNYAAGRVADRAGRRRLLIAGWLIGLSVPLIVIAAPSWEWVVGANLLLGVNQGLCWSMTVVMKVDLAGPARRGLALGANEFAGYAAIGVTAFVAAAIGSATGLRPAPFAFGEVIAVSGLLLSLLTRDTRPLAQRELVDVRARQRPATATFAIAAQAGLVTNVIDGVAWGLLPLYFVAAGLSLDRVGLLAGVYPVVRGVTQLATGAFSDVLGRRWLVVSGMLLQAVAIASLVPFAAFAPWFVAMAALGLGTALVYPTLLAVVSDVVDPRARAAALGLYRLWRDLGYVAGAVLAGVLADVVGAPWAIEVVAALTFCSGAITLVWLRETHA